MVALLQISGDIIRRTAGLLRRLGSLVIGLLQSLWKLWIYAAGVVALVVSGILIATSGLVAWWFDTPIEYGFVIAAGVSNVVALNELGPIVWQSESTKQRVWLTAELVFFCFILGVDSSLALGWWPTFTYILAAAFPIFGLFKIAVAPPPQGNAGQLVFFLLFPLFLVVVPVLNASLQQVWPVYLGSTVLDRSYAWLHLIIIPGVYLLVDSRVAKIDSEWKRFLPLDKCLFWAGLACTISGLSYAVIRPEQAVAPLYEAGAAALLLLVGNTWYWSMKDQNVAAVVS